LACGRCQMPGSKIPDSLTREEGSVDPNIKHPCQTVPPGSPDTPYLSKIPFFLGAFDSTISNWVITAVCNEDGSWRGFSLN
jgi:hypothetical protein